VPSGCYGDANWAYLDGHVKFKRPEQTVDPVWEWMVYNPEDPDGGGTGALFQQRRQQARVALAAWRLRHPEL